MKYELYDENGVVIEEREIEVSLTPLEQIAALEAQVTQRRLREAVLTPEGATWLTDIENQIAALRGGLSA